ncbi:ferredoxin, 2Fe-2S type, ISC system [compost metagenome]
MRLPALVDWMAELLEELSLNSRPPPTRLCAIGQSHKLIPESDMTKLTIVAFDGPRHELDVENGSTVMENAVRNSVPGVEAECGGACACATCHVYVDDAWTAVVGAPEAMEEDMLDFAYDVRPTSRLSCQIKVSDALDGLVVHVPERQA